MGADCFGDVAEGVDSGTTNGLFVGFEKIEKLETDAHPFFSANKLGTSVSDTTYEIDAVLLNLKKTKSATKSTQTIYSETHLFVAIAQNGSEPGKQILDRRRHLLHANDVHDALQPSENRTQNLRVLLA